LTLGMMSTCFVLLRLGKSFSVMAEARKLVVGGPYAYIRHPLYLAEQIALTGVFIHYASVTAALLYAVQVACQVQRMRNEEAILQRSFPDYADYMRRTARLIPGVW
jgi:protein-S-isoprenylcysteine O-methyltransferase Ste14